MKKYIVKETGQEIKIGDRGAIVEKKTTLYGEGKLITEVEITKETLHNLIKDGVVEVREEKTDAEKAEEFKKLFDSMLPAFKKLAKDNDEPFGKVLIILQGLLSFSPKAHLSVLIESMASLKNAKAKRGKNVYALDPFNDYKVCEHTGKSKCPVVFFRMEDAKETYEMLYPFIKIIKDGE